MALLYTKVFINVFVYIAVSGLTGHTESESFESIFDFTYALKKDADNSLDYATKIQALFCPKQPICPTEGDRNLTDVVKTLPETVRIGTEVSLIEDVHKIVGSCCLPCSCDTRTCKENGNCCLSKTFADTLENSPDMEDQNTLGVLDSLDDVSEFQHENVSECMKASWLSYRDKDDSEIADDLGLPAYFMITRCFGNNASQEDMTKCETPSGYDDDVIVPVTSSDTGRTYWNSGCVRCNNDDSDISHWTASVKFNTDIAYFLNKSFSGRSWPIPDTYNDIMEFISKTGNIIYTPPFPLEDKRCLRKPTLKPCTDSRNKSTGSWLEKVCERVYSPLIIENDFGRRFAFLNIFCYLCRQQYIKPSTSRQCGNAEGIGAKSVFVGMSALFDFRGSDSSDNTLNIAPKQEECGCVEIYDHYLVCTIIINCKPRHEKTCLRDFRPGPTQTRLFNKAVKMSSSSRRT